MHHRSSPLTLDEAQFPSVRRLKPLPKRRRTSDATPVLNADDLVSPVTGRFDSVGLIAGDPISQGVSVSPQITRKSCYSSIVGCDNSSRVSMNVSQNRTSIVSLAQTLGWGIYQPLTEEVPSLRTQEGAHRVTDYGDHLQQPGNTKKRKVPANVNGSTGRREVSPPPSVDVPALAGQRDPGPDIPVAALSPATQAPRRGKISLSTRLQHKELLDDRKRQLTAVLGALSLDDTLALDQALSTYIPSVSMLSPSTNPPKVRLSQRRVPRLARAAKFATLKNFTTRAPFPAVRFTFSYASATSDRLLAAKKQMLMLRSRFEAELARHEAKAAADVKQATITVNGALRPKRSERDQQPTRGGLASSLRSAVLSNSPSSKKSRGNKKGVNVAADPHCRKSYDPSSFAGSAQAYAGQGPQDGISLPSLRFLSASIPPRKRQKDVMTPPFHITTPSEEWICPRCEFSLFYSDGPEHKRAIRNRKQILRRRRRAQERAAGGLRAPKTPAKLISNQDHENHYDQSTTQSPSISKFSQWKQGPNIKGIKGHDHLRS